MTDVAPGGRSLQRAATQRSTDARKQRTQRAIVDAVEQLLAEGAETLTVQAIVDRARVSRSSFYAHYESAQDLANALMIEALEDVTRTERRTRADMDRSVSLPVSLRQMVDHFATRRALYRVARALPGSSVAYDRAIARMSEIVEDYLLDLPAVPPGIDSRTVAKWIASGTYGVLDAWVREDLDIDPEELAGNLYNLLPSWYREPEN